MNHTMSGECSFPPCHEPVAVYKAGLCRSHYNQQWRGEELRTLRYRSTAPTFEEYLEDRREIDGSTGCWVWTGPVGKYGYGAFHYGGERGVVHRAAYKLWVDACLGDRIVRHKCTNRLCFNPVHLERSGTATCSYRGGCDNPARTRGLCHSHYGQQRRGLDLRPLAPKYKSDEWYLEEYREVDGESGCWLWTGTVDKDGYGRLRPGRRGASSPLVNRVAYEKWVGPLAVGDIVRHRCGVRRCFNPEHLVLNGLEYSLVKYRDVDPENGCWIWTGSKDSSGYGMVKAGGRTQRVHRASYEFYVGPIGGNTVHHKCANRLCFSPDHLELASRRDNVLEMHERRSLRADNDQLRARVAELEAALSGSLV